MTLAQIQFGHSMYIQFKSNLMEAYISKCCEKKDRVELTSLGI